MGVVYRARDPIINRLVALKTITTGLAADPNLLERFYREAQSAGGLQHPNIVTIYDMGDEQSTPYIAMELIEGESLEQMIARRTSVPLALKLTYALQACRAFDYAHKRGIVHRDIKPGNVMVNRESVVKVVDFGIARVLDTSKTQTGMLIGTFAYMSPEQYHGEHADERSDIWSFGVLLYELLCYERPFTGENPARLMDSVCSHEPHSLRERSPDCPPAMETIISKVLRKSPQDRFQSMEDLLLELEPVYKELQASSIAELIDQSRQLMEKGGFTQARELLRESLKVDSGNSQARALLEKVNAELKRLLIRPKAQQHVDKGRALLGEGRIQEARAEAENALQLDSTFEQAQDLEKQIQRELDRAQIVAEWLQASGQRLAEGMPDEAEELLAKVLEMEPTNKQAKVLLQQTISEKAERQRRLRLLEKMQEARGLWTRQKYEDSIELLTALQIEFPSEDEIQRLLETVREDQAEQYKQNTLERVRNLLAGNSYAECRALLLELQKHCPNDEESSRLLEDVRLEEARQRRLRRLAEARNCLASGHYELAITLLTELKRKITDDEEVSRLLEIARDGQAEQQRQRGIAEARKLLAARRYEDCNALLAQLHSQFPNDSEIPQLQEAVREDKAEQEKLGSLAKARNLLAKRNYDECITLLSELRKRFPNDEEVPRLVATARDGLAEQRKLKSLAEARSLLAARRYGESISLLTELKKEFADEREIARLLANASNEQAEQQKQQKLAEGRALLAAQRFSEALGLLDALRAAYPKDAAVQKLRTLVDRERDKQSRSERLQRELEALKKLISEKKYPELLARAEPLRAEFPANGDLLRLIDFARSQQAQIESEKRLRTAIDDVKTQIRANRFADAIRTADAGLKAFPEHPELVYLREQAEAQEKKQRARGMIEQRIREIKFKINRENFGEAVDLAEETLATIGPDADVTQLLNSARVELQAREKKREQEQKIQEIRTMIESGNVDDAAQTLRDAVASTALDAFDARVYRVSQEIDIARNASIVASPADASSTPANFSKEYAFLQAPPSQTEPPPPEKLGATETSSPQASSSQSAISPQPVAALPPPQFVPIPPMPAAPIAIPRSEPVPVPAAPAVPKRPVEPARVRELARELSTRTTTVGPPRELKKTAMLAAIAMGLILGVWAAIVHSISSHKTEESDVRLDQPNNTHAGPTTNASPSTAPTMPAKPVFNPTEAQQRSAIALSDKLVASGDLKGALQTLQGAEKLNGPLTVEIENKETTVSESMRNDSLAKLRQQEATLWQQATSEVDKAELDAAKRDFRKILATGDGGVRKADAKRYLNDVIPRRQEEEDVFHQAQQSSRTNDQQGLQRAADLFGQVIALNGPRKTEAEELQGNVQSRLTSLKQENLNRQLTVLETTARQNIEQGDLNSARQKADQIRRAGGDPTSLSRDIDQAEANQARLAQEEREFQRAVQAYMALGTRDKNGLEKSRGDFQSIVQEKGPHSSDAQQYLADINKRLDAPNQPAPSPVTAPASPLRPEALSTAVSEEGAIRAVIQRYEQAFEQRSAEALRQVWPTLEAARYARYKDSFGKASSIHMQVKIGSIQSGAGGAKALVTTTFSEDYTFKGSSTTRHKDTAVFQMAKKDGAWFITDVQ
jgi:hypothetical protein